MGLKILLQNSMNEDELGPDGGAVWAGIEAVAKKVIRPDTEVTLRHVDKDPEVPPALAWPWPLNWPSVQPLREAPIISGCIKAQEEGFDAVVIGCALDPGLHQARGLLDIPVVGPGESAFLIAQMLGRKIGIVTPADAVIAATEEMVRFLGFEDRTIKYRPVRHFDIAFGLFDAFKGKPERLIDDFEPVAKELIRDGADVIINACALSGPAFSLCNYVEVREDNVPVVDGVAAALKLAEGLADLKKSLGLKKSNLSTGLYRTPPDDVRGQACNCYAKALV
jgi:allantoin racemase